MQAPPESRNVPYITIKVIHNIFYSISLNRSVYTIIASCKAYVLCRFLQEAPTLTRLKAL